MSLIKRKAIVNYKVSYVMSTGAYGCYDSTKMLNCNLNGNVTVNTIDVWQRQLSIEEEKELEHPSNPSDYGGPVQSLSVTITGFTKLDI